MTRCWHTFWSLAAILTMIVSACSEGADEPNSSHSISSDPYAHGTRVTSGRLTMTAQPACDHEHPYAVRYTRSTRPAADVSAGFNEEHAVAVTMRFDRSANSPEPQETVMNLDIADFDQYRNRLLYLSQDVVNDFSLLIDRTRYPGAISVLSHASGVLPWAELTIGFDVSREIIASASSAPVLLYNDRAFGRGLTRFPLKASGFLCDD